LEAMVRSAQSKEFEDEFHVFYDSRDKSLTLKRSKPKSGNPCSQTIKERSIATVLTSARVMFEKFVHPDIWDAVSPKRYVLPKPDKK